MAKNDTTPRSNSQGAGGKKNWTQCGHSKIDTNVLVMTCHNKKSLLDVANFLH